MRVSWVIILYLVPPQRDLVGLMSLLRANPCDDDLMGVWTCFLDPVLYK